MAAPPAPYTGLMISLPFANSQFTFSNNFVHTGVESIGNASYSWSGSRATFSVCEDMRCQTLFAR